MDAYSEEDIAGLKYASARVNNRQIDTLIGLAKGIIADGVVSQTEAEMLMSWLANNRYTENIMVDTLLRRIHVMLSDNLLDVDEQAELLQLLSEFAGDPGSMGEFLKSAGIPLDDPQPEVVFPRRTFLFTGTCAYGTRKECQAFIDEWDGINIKNVTRKLDYLVIGTYVSKTWMHESFGRKIEKAMEYRELYRKPAIVSEASLGFPIGM